MGEGLPAEPEPEDYIGASENVENNTDERCAVSWEHLEIKCADSFGARKTSEKMWQLREKQKFMKRNELIYSSWLSVKPLLNSSHNNANTD